MSYPVVNYYLLPILSLKPATEVIRELPRLEFLPSRIRDRVSLNSSNFTHFLKIKV